jgi:hypothetical protein
LFWLLFERSVMVYFGSFSILLNIMMCSSPARSRKKTTAYALVFF